MPQDFFNVSKHYESVAAWFSWAELGITNADGVVVNGLPQRLIWAPVIEGTEII